MSPRSLLRLVLLKDVKMRGPMHVKCVWACEVEGKESAVKWGRVEKGKIKGNDHKKGEGRLEEVI